MATSIDPVYVAIKAVRLAEEALQLAQVKHNEGMLLAKEYRRLKSENDALGNTIAHLISEIIDLKEKSSFDRDEELAEKKNEYLDFLKQKAIEMKPIWEKNTPKN